MTHPSSARPRRSCLYMPGANTRALEKARALAADMVIMDLEDSVAPDAKAEARENVVAAVRSQAYGQREVVVRTNALDTAWGEADIEAAVAAGPDGVLVPKVTSAEEVRAIDATLDKHGADAGLGLWIMIEMPLAILNIRDIAATAETTRLVGFVLGVNDLGKELRAIATPDRAAFQAALSLSVHAARAFGLVAIDAVFNDISDEAGLLAECEQGRVLGFDGKSLIHPAQLETANGVFSPDASALAHARAVIAAFALPENDGKGVIKVDGKMTERLHLEQAEQLVDIAEAIEALEQSG